MSEVEVVYGPETLMPTDKTPAITKKIGEFLMESNRYYCRKMKDFLWRYDEDTGIWKPDGEERVTFETARILRSRDINPRNAVLSEVISHLKSMNMIEGVELGAAAKRIVLANGIYDLETNRFSKTFQPEDYHITALPVTYDKSAKATRFVKFLEEVVTNEQERKALVEFFGYCLVKDYPYALWIMVTGSGSNGKSVLLNVLKSFLGGANVSGVPIQAIGETNRFAAAQLFGKLANICADVPSKALNDTGILKSLTGRDMVSVEYKHRDMFEMMNYAKMIFSANEIPKTRDETDAFHRRARVIDFPVKFGHGGKKADPRLTEKLISQEELSGIFNLAVEGWKRMDKQGGLTGEKSAEEKKIDYYRRSDPIQYFAHVFLYQDIDAPQLDKKEFYELYVGLCRHLYKIPVNQSWFGRRVQQITPYMEEIHTTDEEGKRRRVYAGVAIDYDKLEKESGWKGKRAERTKGALDDFIEESEKPKDSKPEKKNDEPPKDEKKEPKPLEIKMKPATSKTLKKWLKEHSVGNSFTPSANDMDLAMKAMEKDFIEEEKVGVWRLTEKGRKWLE